MSAFLLNSGSQGMLSPSMPASNQNIKDYLNDKFISHLERANLAHKKDRILIAASGGLSSTALVYLLAAAQRKWRLSLALGHVFETSQAEEVAKKLSVMFHFPLLIVSKASSLPQAQDSSDEDFNPSILRAIQQQTKSTLIALAHTRDHWEERYISCFLAGGDIDDLADPFNYPHDIIQPLLPFSREECRAFLKNKNFSYFQDPRKLLLNTSQNRVRLLLLPLIRHHIQPRLSEILEKSSILMGDDATFLCSLTKAAQKEVSWEEKPNEVRVQKEKFYRLPLSLRRRLLQIALIRLLPHTTVPKADIYRLERLIQKADNGPIAQSIVPLNIEKSSAILLLHHL